MPAPCRFQFVELVELVEIAKLGSNEARNELAVRFRGGVLRVAEQIVGSREAAQDVAQESLLRAFCALPQLQDAAKFPCWLHTITRNLAQRSRLRESRRQSIALHDLEDKATTQSTLSNTVRKSIGITRTSDRTDVSDVRGSALCSPLKVLEYPDSSGNPLDIVLRSEWSDSIRMVLCNLPPDTRIVIELFYYEQWSAAQIAEFLALPLSTIKWRLHTGRKRLSRNLSALLEET